MPASRKSKTPTEKTAEEAVTPAETKATFRIKELVDQVSEKTGFKKKKELRELTEAILAEIGSAIDRGDVVNLAGLGMARVQRKTETGTLLVKLRRPDEEKQKKSKEPLAAAVEAD